MTIWNLGSINADLAYSVPRLPLPGETIAASSMLRGLGGKGANMSVAAARAASRVVHLGAVGADGGWAVGRMMEYGVDTRHIARVDAVTGHAVILVDDGGENSIVIHHGANHAIPETLLGSALSEASTGDWLLMQNETLLQPEAAALARRLGLKVAYVPAPFEIDAASAVLPFCDLLVLNEVECDQLTTAMEAGLADLGIDTVVVTEGARGGRLHTRRNRWQPRRFAAPQVTSVDTTGAGDTFAGYLVAGLDRGMPLEQAVGMAAKAAALMVTRHGTADVIPDLRDVQEARF
ncbi:ribokinase [Salipiger aestuarii]|uniref:Ribokinase n=1 Tax=Salipiger aestuarii TaxID=568098 RepID=A0A327YKG8_9RHOB|nr:ribokinase [Salipiger aestuarii]EIE50076.1 PfkB [Citreicella sp. 357]KAA8609866.1 ribokinase [Salipiger aestuarii]KAA8616178.1 ribokinase [Salipiger aestuarii]KAB2543126.1 ribokinase [Salipiger aestuarii]RAK21443.1 ribokinase [Salipiger aestuarii]